MQMSDGQQTAAFGFDPQASPADNIEHFLAHLATVDQDSADLLRANISHLLPLPSNVQDRSSARTVFNRNIITALDNTIPDTEGQES